jgi:hypothetical protein
MIHHPDATRTSWIKLPGGLAASQLAFLHVAADALDWCGASRADPLALEAMRERFLPECAFGGRQNNKLGAG